MATRRTYTDEFRASALAALAANGRDVARTAAALDVPDRTLRAWAAGERHPEAAQMCEQKKGPLADRLEEVAWRLAEAIDDSGKMTDAPLNQLAVALGVVIDKVRLLRGEPTRITDSTRTLDLTRLTDAQLLALEDALAAAAVSGCGDRGEGPPQLGGVRPASLAGAEPGPDA